MKPTNEPKTLPETFAIIRDSRRRGGWRVARVRVLLALDLMQAANVREIDWPTEHWLPFARLAKFPRVAGRKLRAVLPPPLPATDEKSAVPDTSDCPPPVGESRATADDAAGNTQMAGAVAGEPSEPWYQRD